jgi:hypothetical protein
MEIRWVWYRTLITLLFNLTCNANGISNIDTKGNLYELDDARRIMSIVADIKRNSEEVV